MHLTRCQPCCALGFKPCNHVFIWMNRFQSDGLTALRCDIWKWSDTNSAPFSGPGPEWVFQSYLKAWIIFPSYIWPHFGLKWVKFSLNNKEKNKANKKKHVFVMPFFIYPFCQNLWFIFISMSAWSTLMFAYICLFGAQSTDRSALHVCRRSWSEEIWRLQTFPPVWIAPFWPSLKILQHRRSDPLKMLLSSICMNECRRDGQLQAPRAGVQIFKPHSWRICWTHLNQVNRTCQNACRNAALKGWSCPSCHLFVIGQWVCWTCLQKPSDYMLHVLKCCFLKLKYFHTIYHFKF